MKRKLCLYFLLIFFQSCSALMEHRPLSYERIPLRDTGPINYCRAHQSPRMILSTNEKAPLLFEQTLKNILTKNRLSPIEQSVLWALFQLNIRPDSSTPQAYLQVMIKSKDDVNYWSFAQDQPLEKESRSYLFGLQELLNHYKSKMNILDLGILLEQNLPRQIPIGKEFAQFLTRHQEKLIESPVFQKSFFKAQMPLTQDETLPRLPYQKLITRQLKKLDKSHYRVQNHLFTKKDESRIRCNFDLNIYSNDIFLIEKEPLDLNNSFAFSTGEDFSFIAVSSQKVLFEPFENSFLVQGTTQVRPASFCHFEKKLLLMSDHGRDPGQILYTYFQEGIQRATKMSELDSFMRSARKMRLYHPDRILFESQRADQATLETLNSQDLPVYHAANFGHVWIWGNGADGAGFLSDPRREGHHLCTATP